jgi:hypothetical protein
MTEKVWMRPEIQLLNAPPKPVRYSLEIYERLYEAGTLPVAGFGAGAPFLPLHPGDLINPRAWTLLDHTGPFAYKLLRVLRVEHGIAEFDDQVIHMILVYTQAVPEDDEARWGGK